MANCTNCGHELEQGAMFCKNCGQTAADQSAPAAAPKAPEAQAKQAQPASEQKTEAPKAAKKNFKDIFKIIDGTNFFSKEDIEQNKIMSLFAYIGLLFLIPLFACKDSKFARFHTNQGIVLCILYVIYEVIFGVIGGITALLFIPDMIFFKIVGGLLIACEGFIAFIIGAALTVLMVLGIISAVTGKAKKLPIIGNIRILK